MTMMRDIDWSLDLGTAPAAEPVTTAEAKAHLRVEDSFTSDDTLIDTYVKAARQLIEETIGRQLITATWKLYLDCFPSVIRLPRPPLGAVSSIAYTDTNGDSQTLSSANYTVDDEMEPARIVPAYGESWPSTYGHVQDVLVTYTAGYGSAGSSVPSPIIAALKIIVGDLYEHRERSVVGLQIAQFPTVDMLLLPYRVWFFGM